MTNQPQLDRIASFTTLRQVRAENDKTWAWYLDGMLATEELKAALDALAARSGQINNPAFTA